MGIETKEESVYGEGSVVGRIRQEQEAGEVERQAQSRGRLRVRNRGRIGRLSGRGSRRQGGGQQIQPTPWIHSEN